MLNYDQYYMNLCLALSSVPVVGLTEEPSSKADGNSVKQRRMSKKTKEEEQRRTAEISTTEQ